MAVGIDREDINAHQLTPVAASVGYRTLGALFLMVEEEGDHDAIRRLLALQHAVRLRDEGFGDRVYPFTYNIETHREHVIDSRRVFSAPWSYAADQDMRPFLRGAGWDVDDAVYQEALKTLPELALLPLR